MPQVACSSDYKLFGGYLGWNTIVPFSEQDTGAGVVPGPNNGTGLSDIIVGPSLTFPAIVKDGHPVFAHGLEFDIIAPTGKYNSSIPVNPGNDYWSISPFWKATWLPAHGYEVSWRVNYIHNFDHISSTNVAGPGGATEIRNGDGVWANFTASKELFKDFYFGLNGYWLKQLSGDTVVGAGKLNNAQESLYMGPGFHYRSTRRTWSTSTSAAGLRRQHSERRLSGEPAVHSPSALNSGARGPHSPADVRPLV